MAEQDGRKVRTDMDEWTEIRRKVLVEGASKRSDLPEYGLGYRTLEKILANTEPPGYRRRGAAAQAEARAVPRGDRRDPARTRIRDAAEAAPHRQADLRAPARRARLRGQRVTRCAGYVARAAPESARRCSSRSATRPGDAQFDFGEAIVEIAGERLQGGARR